jgi:hypothetical protein
METSNDPIDYSSPAAKRWPLSAKAGSIHGTGRWALISRCKRRWRILLYQTESGRDAKYQEWDLHGCGSDCQGDHARDSVNF